MTFRNYKHYNSYMYASKQLEFTLSRDLDAITHTHTHTSKHRDKLTK